MIDEVTQAKFTCILYLAVTSSAMARVFERESTEKIRKKLACCINDFFKAGSEEEYQRKHREFCQWFVNKIKTTRGGRASWGQAAKVIDITLKTCIYYCNLPTPDDSQRIAPWLNAAIDTARLKQLKKRYHKIVNANALHDITAEEYKKLQDKMRGEKGEMWLVQYDDIKWLEGNRIKISVKNL